MPGQHDVDQHHVGGLALEVLEGVLAGGRLGDLPALVLEGQAHRGADALVVLDGEDARAHGAADPTRQGAACGDACVRRRRRGARPGPGPGRCGSAGRRAGRRTPPGSARGRRRPPGSRTAGAVRSMSTRSGSVASAASAAATRAAPASASSRSASSRTTAAGSVRTVTGCAPGGDGRHGRGRVAGAIGDQVPFSLRSDDIASPTGIARCRRCRRRSVGEELQEGRGDARARRPAPSPAAAGAAGQVGDDGARPPWRPARRRPGPTAPGRARSRRRGGRRRPSRGRGRRRPGGGCRGRGGGRRTSTSAWRRRRSGS